MFSFFKKLFSKKNISLIVAIDENRGIGNKNALLFSIKEDMEHFTKKTTGDVVIMGSTTYESIPKKFRPLNNRVNIVLNKGEKEYVEKETIIKNSIENAISEARKYKKDIWIIGGASIYKQMLKFAERIEITQFFAKKEADTFFPEFKNDFYLYKKSKKYFDKKEQIFYQFQTWKRK